MIYFVMDRIGHRTRKGNARVRGFHYLIQARKSKKDDDWGIYRGTGKAGTTAFAGATAAPARGAAPTPARVGGDDAAVKTVRRDEPKVGRNDPCPCGSGKKYKKCHGAAA